VRVFSSVRPSAALLVLAAALPAGAGTPTTVTVRVLAAGAKFVGSSMGGALVTLRDADTGELLASGPTSGGTGNTDRIMRQRHGRDRVLATPDAAAFTAVLDLDRPRRIEARATGPLAAGASGASAASTRWVLPGHDLTAGDGWLLELPGLALQLLEPAVHTVLDAPAGDGPPLRVPVAVNLVMLCGCPVEPGGLWDAGRFEVMAEVSRDGEPAIRIPLAHAGRTSRFAAEVPITASGTYVLTVTAWDPVTGGAGVVTGSFIVR